jgi:hypothetical protein
VAAEVFRRNSRNICCSVARIRGPSAEIDILKPDRIEALIQAAETLPDVSPEHEKCARRLLYQAFPIKIVIQITVAPVDRIRRPQPV